MKLRSTEDGSTTVIENAKWVKEQSLMGLWGWSGENEFGEKRFFPYGIWEDPDNPIENN